MNETMSDEEFFERFEGGALDARIFSHSAHVKMAWIYLGKYDLPEALHNFSRALKNFAKVNNAPALYHETITFAYLSLIHERIQRDGGRTWVEFALTNPDIFDWKESILKKYYREETLKSDFAKKYFVFPDKFGTPNYT